MNIYTRKPLRLAFAAHSFENSTYRKGTIEDFFSKKTNPHGQLLLALEEYFIDSKKMFNEVQYILTFVPDQILDDGTYTGIIKYINLSYVDIGVVPMDIYELTRDVVDFSYPYRHHYYTFVTPKPQYKPQVFGILKTLSLSVWIAIILVFIAMLLVYYAMLKCKYSFKTIFFHVFAVLIRQNSIILPSSFAEKLLVYSWVAGAMFLCLAYDSVFLSFLTIPPVTKIKHFSDLARAIENKGYHCKVSIESGLGDIFFNSDQKDFRIIGKDINKTNIINEIVFNSIFNSSNNPNHAYFVETNNLDYLEGKYFISEDRIFKSVAAMMVRKEFCCKQLLNTFVHRMMASGIYYKYFNDATFLISLPYILQYTQNDTLRKLTLTDVSPAFIFLLIGYVISTLCLIGEIWSNRKQKFIFRKKNKRRRLRKV